MRGHLRTDIMDRGDDIEEWITTHKSKAFICRELHCKPSTLEAYLIRLGLEYRGNKGLAGKLGRRKPVEEDLYYGSLIKTHELKLRLLRDGVKQHQCEVCRIQTWRNQPVPLELHHISGDSWDNRLENLQLLCPNCHAQTPNYAGKNKHTPR